MSSDLRADSTATVASSIQPIAGGNRPRRRRRTPRRRTPRNPQARHGLLDVGRGVGHLRRVVGVLREPEQGDHRVAELGHRQFRLALPGGDAGHPGLPDLPGVQPIREHPARQGHRPPRIQHSHLAGDDPQRGDGHRAGVLRCRGTDLAPGDPATRPGRARLVGGGGARPAVLLQLRLGSARLGNLRRVRPGHRVFHLSQGPQHAGKPDVRAAARRPGQRPHRQDHRRARGVRDVVRHHHITTAWARCRSTTVWARCSASRSTT